MYMYALFYLPLLTRVSLHIRDINQTKGLKVMLPWPYPSPFPHPYLVPLNLSTRVPSVSPDTPRSLLDIASTVVAVFVPGNEYSLLIRERSLLYCVLSLVPAAQTLANILILNQALLGGGGLLFSEEVLYNFLNERVAVMGVPRPTELVCFLLGELPSPPPPLPFPVGEHPLVLVTWFDSSSNYSVVRIFLPFIGSGAAVGVTYFVLRHLGRIVLGPF